MPLVFPPSPSIGDTYTDDNGVVWQFDGVKWNVVTGTLKKVFNGVRVSFTSTYSLSSTEAAVSWDSEDFDTGQYWSIGTPARLTISQTGYYNINATFFASTAGAGYSVKVKLNGTTDLINGTLNANQSAGYNQTIQLNAGDYLEVYASEALNVGGFTTDTYVELVQMGLGVGTGVNSMAAFSGVKTYLTSAFSTNNTATGIAWTGTTYDVNANALALTYWSAGLPTRITVKTNGFYQVTSYVKNGSTGSNYTLTLRKNGVTTIATVTDRNPNDQSLINEVYSLNANDYLEILVSSATNGTVTTDTYFELIRLGF